MTPITISAEVVDGHLHHDVHLTDLEGQRVIATLTVVPTVATNGKPAPTMPKPEESTDFDPEPPPWLEVENDVYFPMTVAEERLGKVSLRIETGKPCIILPEELPDD